MKNARLMPRSIVHSLWGRHHVGLLVEFFDYVGQTMVEKLDECVGDFTLAVIMIG